MTKRAEIVAKVFDLLNDACYMIQENDQCSNCPRKHTCLNDHEMSVVEFADLISAGMWDEFIEFADKCIPSEELEELMRYAYESEYDRNDDLD